MKPKRISDPFRKGRQYAFNKQKQLLLSLLALVAVVFVLGIYQEAMNHFFLSGLAGTLATMGMIGNVKDVSDRDTSGSKIAYQVYLINRSQIDTSVAFPQPNASRQVSTIPMLGGEFMYYFEAHDIPTYGGTGEKGDITTTGTNTFTAIMGGMRDQLLNFIEEFAGDKFIVLFKEVGSTQWFVVGDYDSPMVLSSFDAKHDKDGRYVTFTFKRTSLSQYYKYTGAIVSQAASNLVADNATMALGSASEYNVPDGSAATYAYNAISGLTANDKGRYITLYGKGTTKSATIPDSSYFVMEDGATWTAKAGSRITFLVMDPTTLVEVAKSRVQSA